MGKLFAPHYADIFMAHWEKGALSTCPIKPLVYLRFLDDIFIIWRGSREQFEEFLAILNNHHESIKLKAEFSDQAVNFLDTTVFKGNGFTNNHILDTQVYFKPTDTSGSNYYTPTPITHRTLSKGLSNHNSSGLTE